MVLYSVFGGQIKFSPGQSGAGRERKCILSLQKVGMKAFPNITGIKYHIAFRLSIS